MVFIFRLSKSIFLIKKKVISNGNGFEQMYIFYGNADYSILCDLLNWLMQQN